MKTKPCFGIVSYFPWGQPERKERQDRLDRLVGQLSSLWPDVPIIIIAQQWKFYNLNGKCKNKVFRYDFGKLGIMGARNKLREKFLESDFDYLIMFDDDAILQCDTKDANVAYMNELDKHPNGFCFIDGNGSSKYTKYNDSQLNLCAISRYIYEREPLPNVDPQKSEGFEDRIWSTLLHFKYADMEFKAPSTIRCIHFKNANETAPSTWSNERKYEWRKMRRNTTEIEDYISKYHEVPNLDVFLERHIDKDGRHYIQLLGNCSDIGYLGANRLRGPVDNVLTKGKAMAELLLNNKYYAELNRVKPEEFKRKPSFAGDQTIGYDYPFAQIIHNVPTEKKYLDEIYERVNTFNTFYECLKARDNYFFVVCLNMYDIDNVSHEMSREYFLETVDYLKEMGVLDKTIFVQTKTVNIQGTANWWSDEMDRIAKERKLKCLTISDNIIRGPGVEISHAQFLRKVKEVLNNGAN